MSAVPPSSELAGRSDQEIREILRRRKKKRDNPSCHPCRSRKVKCDRCLPCENCSKKGYPELCSFSSLSQPQTSQIQSASLSPSRCSPPQTQFALSFTETDSRHQSLPSRSEQNNHPPASSSSESNLNSNWQHTASNGEEEPREHFLGTDSIPSFVREEVYQNEATRNSTNIVKNAILPILGLTDSSSTYPFHSASESSLAMVIAKLPANHEIINLFQCYRQESHAFSPTIPDIEEFELEMCSFLERIVPLRRQARDRNLGTTELTLGKPLSWLASLFAVMASGTQYSRIPIEGRQVRSRHFAQCSFECLRLANFLLRPTLLCIQALLILGHFLQNDMQPEAAWILLGTTVRMAQSLGLHNQDDSASQPQRALWKSLVFQDSLLCMCFDRPLVVIDSNIGEDVGERQSYFDFMISLCRICIQAMDMKTKREAPNFNKVCEEVAKIEEIRRQSADIRSGIYHTSGIRQRSEICALDLHTSFSIAWLCRPALRNSRQPELRTEIQLRCVEMCIQSLLECTRAFIKLHSLSLYAERSWAVIHNGLSSALLLGLLDYAATDPEIRQSQGDIIEILSGGIELSVPHTRALASLTKMYNNSQVAPVNGASGDSDLTIEDDLIQSRSNNIGTLSPQLASVSNAEGPSYLYDSPLDMFDSILFDSIEVDESMLDSNVMSFDNWIL